MFPPECACAVRSLLATAADTGRRTGSVARSLFETSEICAARALQSLRDGAGCLTNDAGAPPAQSSAAQCSCCSEPATRAVVRPFVSALGRVCSLR